MQKLTITDLLPIADYELTRDDYRRDILAHKQPRRVNLGPDVALTFEDRLTMTFQVQEMMRAESMVAADAIQAELDIYNTLIPDAGELSATLFIEITESGRIKEQLHQFIGLTTGDRLWLEAGDLRSYAQFEAGRSTADQISSVHYLRFLIGDDLQAALSNAARSPRIVIAHGDYRYAVDLPPETRQALLGDLAAK